MQIAARSSIRCHGGTRRSLENQKKRKARKARYCILSRCTEKKKAIPVSDASNHAFEVLGEYRRHARGPVGLATNGNVPETST